MNPVHVLRRLARMGPHEIYVRGTQELHKRGDALSSRVGRTPYRPPENGLEERGRFFGESSDIPAILDTMRSRMPEHVEDVVHRAERILARRFDLLGYTGLDFGQDLDWELDPVSGRRAPHLPWPSIPFLDFRAVGDHKVIWELSRHQFLITLAKAARLTGDSRFAADLKALWYDWQRKNPYPMGINWASTLEVAFRAISWMWLDFLLPDDPKFRQDLTREIARSAWYIHRYLSWYFSPNTHLMGEGVALFLIGARYPGLKNAGQWKSTGWKITLEESRRQVRPDGLHFEQSTYYDVYALDFFLQARLMAARNGIPVPAEFDRTIRGMLRALAELSQAGALPRFGDDDGGRLFDGARNREEHMLDPLATGAVLFQDPALKAASRGFPEETLWLLGPGSAAAYDSLAVQPSAPHAAAFEASGIYTMAAPGEQLFIDAGVIGAHSAGHGHADALSVQLAAGGRLWLVDPGAGAYASADSRRDRFRDTPAHNTLTVDGRGQLDPRGPFGWGPLPQVEARRWFSGKTLDVFEGSHSGYQRLSPPALHRRWVVGSHDGLWLVRDVVEGEGSRDLDVWWHFAPDLEIELRDGVAIARMGQQTLSIASAGGEEWHPALVQSEYSPAYGVSIPAPAVKWHARTALPAEFAVLIGFGEPAVLVRRGCGPAACYDAGARRFLFAKNPGVWQCEEWRSDAALLAFDGNGIVAAGVSLVERGGRKLLGSDRPLPYWEGAP